MASVVVITGHSWVKGLAENERKNKTAPNRSFDINLHRVRYVYKLPGTRLLARTDHVMGDLTRFYQAVGTRDLVVITLGTNDLAQDPGRWKQWADSAIQIGRQLAMTQDVRQYLFVPVFPRFRKKGL